MPVRNEPSLVDFDVEAAMDAVESTLDGELRSLVEYTREAFNPVYVADSTLAFYDDESAMLDHFERIHSYVHLDFAELELFTEELFPIADGVRYIATGMDVFTLVRVYVGDQGLFLALDADEPVEPVVEAIASIIEGTGATPDQ